MKTLTLVVDERELSTIQAALLLLQEQVSALPEDLAEMMSEHGPAMTEKAIGRLSHRLADSSLVQAKTTSTNAERLPRGTLVEVGRSLSPTYALE